MYVQCTTICAYVTAPSYIKNSSPCRNGFCLTNPEYSAKLSGPLSNRLTRVHNNHSYTSMPGHNLTDTCSYLYISCMLCRRSCSIFLPLIYSFLAEMMLIRHISNLQLLYTALYKLQVYINRKTVYILKHRFLRDKYILDY